MKQLIEVEYNPDLEIPEEQTTFNEDKDVEKGDEDATKNE